MCRETDVQALQQKCRQLLRQQDNDRLTRRQDLLQLERLQAQCDNLGDPIQASVVHADCLMLHCMLQQTML